eukprot:12312516-Alexandrium_andersonii.AAC.1
MCQHCTTGRAAARHARPRTHGHRAVRNVRDVRRHRLLGQRADDGGRAAHQVGRSAGGLEAPVGRESADLFQERGGTRARRAEGTDALHSNEPPFELALA